MMPGDEEGGTHGRRRRARCGANVLLLVVTLRSGPSMLCVVKGMSISNWIGLSAAAAENARCKSHAHNTPSQHPLERLQPEPIAASCGGFRCAEGIGLSLSSHGVS